MNIVFDPIWIELNNCSSENPSFFQENSFEEKDNKLNFFINDCNDDDLGKKSTSNKIMMKNPILKFLKQIIMKMGIQIAKKKNLLAKPMIK